MSEQSGFFWNTAATAAGGPLTETEFFAALDGVFQHQPASQPLITSPRVIEQARADAVRQGEMADRVSGEWHRTRRWRIFKRARLKRLEVEHLRNQRALEHTFGR